MAAYFKVVYENYMPFCKSKYVGAGLVTVLSEFIQAFGSGRVVGTNERSDFIAQM